MQQPVSAPKRPLSVSPVIVVALSVIALSVLALIALPGSAGAQVSISLGAQEMYDDNVFLEGGDRRPSFVLLDDQFEEDFNEGEVPTILSDELDGEESDDLITNLSISFAGDSPYLKQYMTNRAQFGVGFILFADYSSQNRLTLDGILDTAASKEWLPDPYYIGIANAFNSDASDNVSSAEGTASRATQTYVLTGRTGVAGIPLAEHVTWGLGYTGGYHVFLGELRFDDTQPGEVEEEGSDYHTHSVGSNVDYAVSKSVTVGVRGEAGVQLYTNVETNDIDQETRESDDLDRNNYDGRLTMNYAPDKQFKFGSFVGLNYSEYREDQLPTEVTVVDDQGQTTTVTVARDDSTTNFIFGADTAYTFFPGTQIQLGAEQGVGTDVDGDRITTRSFFSNGVWGITDRLSWTVGGRFLQFSSTDELDNATDRLELSTSMSFLVTQQTSLVLGYNYVDQSTDDPLAEEALLTRSEEYTVNRVYIGISVGILGLPG